MNYIPTFEQFINESARAVKITPADRALITQYYTKNQKTGDLNLMPEYLTTGNKADDTLWTLVNRLTKSGLGIYKSGLGHTISAAEVVTNGLTTQK